MTVTLEELAHMARTGAAAFKAVPHETRVEAVRLHARARWADIRRRHDEGESGRNVLSLLTDTADEIVRAVTDFGLYGVRNRQALLSRVALCALGGYGRRELSPHSDLDICLLYDHHLDDDVQTLNRFLLPFLWDIGYTVGYALHSVQEAVALTSEDPRVLTTYAQARLLVGDSTTFARLRLMLAEERARDTSRAVAYVREREHAENLTEIHRDLFSAEPNIKESVGGLRDYHAAQWLILLTHGPMSLEDMVRLGHITVDEHLDMAEGLDFLWRIRNEMHFHAGKEEDHLTYAMQSHVARTFDYGYPERKALERFMQDYYAAARQTHRFLQMAARVCDHQMEMAFDTDENEARKGITTVEGRIAAGMTDPHWFEENPPRLMEVFWESARRHTPLSERTKALVAANLGLVGSSFQTNDVVRRFFMAICGRPLQAGLALRQAAQTGLLAAYLPEFAAIQGIVRYEDFHSFPVDEHTIRCIEALAHIPNMEGPVGRSLQRHLEHLRDPHLLVFSILLHDLGKVSGEAHTEKGVRLALQICRRIGLSNDDTERVCFLVKHHMLMSNIGFYRDTDDPEVVKGFAATMRSDNRLRALLLLSYADLSGVGPAVWTEWKGALLLKLYLKTERMLSGRAVVGGEAYWNSPKAEDVHRHAGAYSRAQVNDYLRGMGEHYFLSFHHEHIARDMACVEEARKRGLALRHVRLEDTGVSEVVVCTRDRHGLFTQLAGSFTSQLADVQGAALFTTPDGLTLDCFTVTDAANRRPLTEAQFHSMEEVLKDVLLNGGNIQEHVDRSRRRLFALLQPRVPIRPGLTFDNHSSRTHTVIDMEAGDRTGLLYDVARVLTDMGVDFHSARIITDATQVHDAFYVQMHGKKIEDEATQAAIEARAIRVLDPQVAVEN